MKPVSAATVVEEDEGDIFSDKMVKEHSEVIEATEHEVVGGDTASFRPLVIDEDEDEDGTDSTEEGEE